MADKPVTMKMVDIEHKFKLHKLSHKTKVMTFAFSSTAGAICLVIFLILICVARKRSRDVQVPNQIFKSCVTMSSLLPENEYGLSGPAKETTEEAHISKTTSQSRLY